MDSLIGTVPDNWRQASLGDICDILAGPSGARLDTEARTRSNVPVVRPRDLRDNMIGDDGRAAVSNRVAKELARYRLATGDVVCARAGDLGRQALVDERQIGWLIGSSCMRLRVNGPVTGAYLAYYLAHPTAQDWIIRNATGSATPSVNTRTLGAMPVVIPPAEVQSAVTDLLRALDDKVRIHAQISRTTATLRDSLLPLVLTGSLEIGVPSPGNA